MIKNPKISIVTPVFNCAKYIEETIQSVLAQDYQNIEYIIIDGGSTDGTCEVIEKYSKQINFFVSEKDQGMYDALDKGFKMAEGKYLSWLNADDLYFNNCISRTIELMEKNNYQWINGISATLLEKEIKLRPLYHYPSIIIKNRLMTPCLWGYIPQESTIFTKELYIKSGGINRELKYAGDFDLWNKFSKNSELISINIPIGIFRKRDNQISQNQKIYLREVNKINCFIPFGKLLRFIYSVIINNINKYVKKN